MLFRLALLVVMVAEVARYALLILETVAAAALVWWFVRQLDHWLTRRNDERATRATVLAAIAARADQQHAWTLAGDGRGTYGRFPPCRILKDTL